MTKTGTLACCLLLWSCGGGPAKPTTPPLTEGTAIALLQLNNRAKGWLEHVKKENAACDYKIELPDQASNPTTIDLDHIVFCGGRPAPKALDATVSFVYDQNAGHWTITRFLS